MVVPVPAVVVLGLRATATRVALLVRTVMAAGPVGRTAAVRVLRVRGPMGRVLEGRGSADLVPEAGFGAERA